MILANTKFLTNSMSRIINENIDDSLREILINGFTYEANGCTFIKSTRERNLHISESDFHDLTGLECFINAIHIDDFSESDVHIQSFLFIELLSSELRKFSNESFFIIASETEDGVVVRFHTVRDDEEWVNIKALDTYQEAIMLFRI